MGLNTARGAAATRRTAFTNLNQKSMARTAKVTEDKALDAAVSEEAVKATEQKAAEQKPQGSEAKIPDYVDEVLKRHPKMKRAWVNTKGYIFTENTLEHMTEGGTLYENKYYKS